MGMLRDVGAADIKEPFFDRPKAASTAISPISEGTRVVLEYHGKQLSAQVMAVVIGGRM